MNTMRMLLLTAITTSVGISSSKANQSLWNQMDADFSTMNQLMKTMQDRLNQAATSTTSIWQEPKPPIKKHTDAIRFEEVSDAGAKIYQLILHLPGFNKNQTKVSLKKNLLTIEAIKDFKEKEKTEEGRVVRREESYRSSSSFNGNKQTIIYKNGALKATYILPKDINDETKYECMLQDDKLLMKFFRQEKDQEVSKSLVVKKK